MQFSPTVVIGILQIRGINANFNVRKWIYDNSAIALSLVLNLKYVWTMDVV